MYLLRTGRGQPAGPAPADASPDVPETTLAEWLQLGPYTLALSSSFFGYYAHAGVLQALEEAGILPAKVCGSSSGSVISTLWVSYYRCLHLLLTD